MSHFLEPKIVELASNEGMRHAAALLAVCLGASCTSHSPIHPAVQPGMSQALLDARLAEADALAARGCYLCLREAAGAYSALLQMSDSPAVVRKTLENDLMIAVREVELRLPDSGARQRAQSLRARTATNDDVYFAAVEALGTPLVDGGRTWDEIQRQRAERRDLVVRLEAGWPGSPMAAYFYIATAVSAGEVTQLRPQLSAIADTHSEDLSVRYRLQSFAPAFSEDASNELLRIEPRFAEVHFVLGQRAIQIAALVTAHRELTLAHEALPESAAIARVLGYVEMAFARYPEALALYDQVLASGPDEQAQLGRAIALSYLRRHRDALAVLADLLKRIESYPGDKYYWSAWNHLQLGESQPAYEEAKAALQGMANADVYRLAGIASYNLAKPAEARGYFESSLKMNAGDCDSLRYLGLMDSAERSWPVAATRFTAASACYQQLIDKLSADLAEKQADTSGLAAGQISSLTADITEAQAMLEVTTRNAGVSARNATIRSGP